MVDRSCSRVCGSVGGWARLLAGGLFVAGIGCGALNPAFLNLLDVADTGQFATLQNAPGHVVVSFINNAQVSERLVSYLESAEGGGLALSDEEKRELRPRMRFRVQITFQNGATLPIEFVDGSSSLVDPSFDANAIPDLNQNDLDNVVVICDVQRVEILPDSEIEVFIPVPLEQYDERIINTNQTQTIDFILDEIFLPQFRALEIDDIDGDGNILLRRNIGVRDVPAPVDEVLCGSVISITVNGELEVPFQITTDPSYDGGDEQVVAGIGGRYEFIVTAQ